MMPYVKRAEKPYAKMSRLLLGYGLNAARLAPILDVSEPTARKRLDRPELLTLNDLDRINRYGHVPIDEIKMAIVR